MKNIKIWLQNPLCLTFTYNLKIKLKEQIKKCTLVILQLYSPFYAEIIMQLKF